MKIEQANAPSASSANAILYVGTHRRAHRADVQDIAFGIYSFAPDDGPDGFVSGPLTETLQPGWLAFSPDGTRLYAVNEVRAIDGREGGAISAFAIDHPGAPLRALNSQPLPPMPCHCLVDGSGHYLLAATFGGGSVHLFRINADGSIGEELDRYVHMGSSAHPQRQTQPHAHAVLLSPDERFLLVPDLGADRLFVYRFDRDRGRLIPLTERSVVLPPLSGPRHAVFAPDGRHLYLINEMSASITVFTWDSRNGALRALQTVDLLPDGLECLKSGGAIAIHPDGRRLFATTRSHGSSGMPDAPGLDLLVWFTVDPQSGLLKLGARLPSGGGIPRSIALSPDGERFYVGHQCSGTIVEYAIYQDRVAPTGKVLTTPVPVCLTFPPKAGTI